MDAINIEGNIIDQLEVTKTDGRLDKKYLLKAISTDEVERYRSISRPVGR
jgi:hypothetical protein